MMTDYEKFVINNPNVQGSFLLNYFDRFAIFGTVPI